MNRSRISAIVLMAFLALAAIAGALALGDGAQASPNPLATHDAERSEAPADSVDTPPSACPMHAGKHDTTGSPAPCCPSEAAGDGRAACEHGAE